MVTPNQFELEWLTGRKISGLEDAIEACQVLRQQGPETVICTSLDRADASDAMIETLLVNADGAWLAETTRLEAELFGAGDLFAALFLGHWLDTRDPAEALSRAVSGTGVVLAETDRQGGGELALIAAQHEMVQPPSLATVKKVR